MNIFLIICIFILVGCSSHVQGDRIWTAYYDDNSSLIGFKDQDGRTRVEPKYTSFTTARKFDGIVAVMEQRNDAYEAYYLTKSGKRIGKDNVYMFDNSPDCESEGFIRFQDRKTGKVGLYNSEGAIAIPAEYDDLTNVRNGLVIALKGAEKKCWDENKDSLCDHFSWVGGTAYLVNTENKIIITPFATDSALDFFSIKIDAAPVRDEIRQSFPGIDGRCYAFIDYQKEFTAWLNSALLSSFSKKKLADFSYRKIYYWKEPDGWTSEVSGEFIDRNFELLKSRLAEMKKDKTDYFISIDGLNPFIYEAPEFETYFNNCGEAKTWQYPVMSVMINHKSERDLYQDHFEFLRTKKGYRLISVTIRNGNLE